MGYTHYWKKTGKVSQSVYANALNDIRKIVETNKSILADGSGDKDTQAEVSDGVRFNGICHSQNKDDSHETFSLPALAKDLQEFDFCKTNRKPYDDTVVACLIVLHNYCSGMTVNSDGDGEEHEGGLNLARRVLGNNNLVTLGEKVPANAVKFIESIPKSKTTSRPSKGRPLL